jgi:hypothetical protein
MKLLQSSGIAQYSYYVMGCMVKELGSIPDMDKSLFSSLQSSGRLWAHPASYSTEAGDVSPGSERQEHEADYLSPSNTYVKNYVPVSSLPHVSPCCGA